MGMRSFIWTRVYKSTSAVIDLASFHALHIFQKFVFVFLVLVLVVFLFWVKQQTADLNRTFIGGGVVVRVS